MKRKKRKTFEELVVAKHGYVPINPSGHSAPKTPPPTKAYRENWTRIFGKR